MKKAKIFCCSIIAFCAVVLVYNLLVWHLATKSILTHRDGVVTGDLARLGYLPALDHPRRNSNDLPRRHWELADYPGAPVDVITLGDSFSQGGGGGPNRFYQDYLASLQDLSVLNLPRLPGRYSMLEQLVILANSGYLDLFRPRVVLLEVVERSCYKMAGPVDFNLTLPLEEIVVGYRERSAPPDDDEDAIALPQVGFMNTGNLKWLRNAILYRFSPNAFGSKTYKVPLERPLFSVGDGRTLLFLAKDLSKLTKHDEPTVASLAANLNGLAALLRARGIALAFMPAIDKYNLYRPYIEGAAFGESRFFELLREQPLDFRLIDTKKILAPLLAAGEKDIYYSDDTHWSWKASEAIFRSERLVE